MIHVQHLLGVGHLRRMHRLAGALAGRGLQVDLVSGGMPQALPDIDGVNFHQLPPARSPDANFTRLVDTDGRLLDEAWRVARRRRLLDLFDRLRPQALVTESFPFGRRLLRFELLPLIELARRSRCCRLLIASIRDILQPRSAERNRATCELIEAYYDRVLVHGDPAVARLEDSFADANQIENRIFYSGYIADHAIGAASDPAQREEVLVSAGGSATGYAILAAAIAARPLCRLAGCRWRILVSPAVDDEHFAGLQRAAGDGVVVERNRADFADLMGRAVLSISQAGYNTVCDLLAAHTPAVVIPFAEAGEAEQTLRAQRLQAHRRAVVLSENELTAENLAAAIDRAQHLDTRLTVDLDGAASSAAAIENWLSEIRP